MPRTPTCTCGLNTCLLCYFRRTKRESRKKLTEARSPDGYIYLLETSDSQFVKIGHSISPHRRLSSIGTLVPGVRLIGCFPGTKTDELHEHMKWDKYLEIGEWFRHARPLRQYIAKLGKRPDFIKPSTKPTHRRIYNDEGRS